MRSDDQVLQYSMNVEKEISNFDFDRWSAMAQQDPEKFETMRQQLISDLLAQTPPHLKQRMIGLQGQVDQIRKQASNPDGCLLTDFSENVGQCAGRERITSVQNDAEHSKGRA